MKTLTLTDKEFAQLRDAVTIHLDIANDTVIEDVDLYPSADQPIVLTREKAKEVRDQILRSLDRLEIIQNLARKCGVEVPEK